MHVNQNQKSQASSGNNLEIKTKLWRGTWKLKQKRVNSVEKL